MRQKLGRDALAVVTDADNGLAFFLPALNYYLFFCIAQRIGDYIRKSTAQMNFIAADRYGVVVKYRGDTQISLLREVLRAAQAVVQKLAHIRRVKVRFKLSRLEPREREQRLYQI